MNLKRGKTGLIYDLRMTEHRCLWNSGYPECPERFTRILARCDELKLIERCHPIPSRPATLNEILLKHTREHYEALKVFDGETDVRKLEEMCTHYDVFIHPSTFELSMLAVGCAIELVDKILVGEVQNGMAVIRPPGHHAMEAQFDGFCFFNNVAIAAQHAVTNHGVNRILIVDFDVHHGNGTQQLFYDDPRVLYFSIHRYDYGTFFPGLRESDFDYVGEGQGTGFNFNVPLNRGGMTNSDYLAIWQQILLPVAFEVGDINRMRIRNTRQFIKRKLIPQYQPELVLISAGYDAAYGCALGEMEITPACYAHLISPLMALANGRIAAFLEGGYNLDSLAESAAITLKTFLGDPCPLLEMLDEPSDSVRDSILNCTQSHKAYWRSLQVHKEYSRTAPIGDPSNIHQVVQKFIDDKELNPWHNCDYYDTRVLFPNQTRSKEDEEKISQHLQYLKSVTNLDKPLNRTCFVLSPNSAAMKGDVEGFLLQYDLLNSLNQTEQPEISEHALTLQLVQHVLGGKYLNGILMERGEATFGSNDSQKNSVADSVTVALQYAIDVHGLKRVLVVDLCKINQQIIVKPPYPKRSTLHMSVDLSNATDPCDSDKGVLVPMNKETVGDSDYVAAFQRIIMPIAYEFNPELVLISADFDAVNKSFEANISPETFGYVTHWLSALANGKLILFSKGESGGTANCINGLLGNPLQMPENKTGTKGNDIETIQNVLAIQQDNWKCLKFNKMLPAI